VAVALLNDALGRFFPIGSIGLTGQMHGILYVDAEGLAVSPLYTWQDTRLTSVADSGKTYAEEIQEKTGYLISPGYGLGTHYCMLRERKVPKEAVKLCTVMDYIGARLVSAIPRYIHPTNAASLGFYLITEKRFDLEALKKLDVDPSFLPEVKAEPVVLGIFRDVPVFQAIGDNQASVLYSLNDAREACLVNIGTGSQISRIVSEAYSAEVLELRPFFGKDFLLVGSALCGGKAYAMLEEFFHSYVKVATGRDDDQYDTLNRLAKEALEAKISMPKVRTTFAGTRSNSSETGSITGLTESSYTPEAIVLATLQGIVDELYEMYESLPVSSESIVASGNAVRRNKVLQTLIANTFALPLTLLGADEEAAGGAALFSISRENIEE
ncbi:MAG: hypothetical protein IJ091_07965, partial [Oscillospiraceae bacterium]|nr:hypothetical protein [Oscillospiraceae bacterium]